MTNEVSTVGAEVSGVIGQQFSQGRELAEQIVAWLTEKGLDFAVNLAMAAVIFLAGWLLIRVVNSLLRKALMRGKAKQTLFVNFICSVVSKSCWAILFVTVAGRLGVNVGPIIAGLGVTGFILGFAFQESLGNLASGMMIAINEPFKVGDWVDAGGHSGAVLEVNMMATVLASADNKRIVIPNKSVWGGPIVNYNTLGVRRVDMQVGIDYGEDVRKAMDVVMQVLLEDKRVLRDPAPVVAVASLDDSAVTLNVRPWARCADYWDVRSDILAAVKSGLSAAGVSIPFPQITIHKADA